MLNSQFIKYKYILNNKLKTLNNIYLPSNPIDNIPRNYVIIFIFMRIH